MHIYIVFAHPNRESFTGRVLDSFCHGLEEAGHSIQIADLYEMGFKSEMDILEFIRETTMNANAPIPEDVKMNQPSAEGKLPPEPFFPATFREAGLYD